jgi:drug/metabolite transporter (DMT)-like permease
MIVATLLAVGAALLHAGWNLAVKTSTDRLLAAWGQFLAGGLISLTVLFFVGFPDSSTWPNLAASAVVNMIYIASLVRAYDVGDFSLIYPLARGGGALIATLGGWLLLGDSLPMFGWFGVAVVFFGLTSLLSRRPHWPSVRWALVTSTAIASYTLIDSAGSRNSTGISYALASFVGAAIAISIWGVARGRAQDLLANAPLLWRRWAMTGLCTVVAYTLVLVAIRHAPVGYVATIRESSVVFGAFGGWLFLKEQLAARRAVSSGVIMSGMVLLIAAR